MVTTGLRVARSAWRVDWWASILDARVETGLATTEPIEEGTKRATRNAQRATLWAIVALAAIVRLWGLGGQPVLYFDSGVYLGEGAFLASVAERGAGAFMRGGAGGVALELQDGTDAHPPDIAKPGHAILLALSILVLGKTALAGALVSALAGIGTVAATYAIGMRRWGPPAAVPPATFFSISRPPLVSSPVP